MQMQRNHKIKSHFGVLDYHRFYIKRGGKLSRALFGDILRDINKMAADKILEGYVFKMPHRLGTLSVTKKKEFIGFKDGRAVTNRPIDFKTTRELWASDPEAKEQRKLVRYINKHSNGWIYKIAWSKHPANFTNKTLYSLQVNREVKRGLAKAIFNGFTVENRFL